MKYFPGPIYPFTEDGKQMARIDWFGLFIDAKYLVFEHKGKWLIFETAAARGAPGYEIARAWAAGSDGMSFPSLTAARTFLVLGGKPIG